ncbi:MAG: FAD-dependent oxidoreductase [Cytophagales bacterium]|nr:FAD-dependent oxidoreductase [Cytophagales bacterium]
MTKVDAIIIGAGLSGLLTAIKLKEEGYSILIIEAKDRVGGRINTLKRADDTYSEMGATWFANEHHELKKLLEEYDMKTFEQYISGTSFFHHPNNTFEGFVVPSLSMGNRIQNGTSSIINALYQQIEEKEINLNSSVNEIKDSGNGIEVITDEATFLGSHVVITIPPQIWSNNITFVPQLPTELISIAQNTHTWMSNSAKISVSYKTSFWRERDLSGVVFSNFGPITELYDHCNLDGSNAVLSGFVHPSIFNNTTFLERKLMLINMLEKVFGSQAREYDEINEYHWAEDEQISVKNATSMVPHQNNGHFIFRETQYGGKLVIAGTETSRQSAGYMEGAMISAKDAVKKIIQKVSLNEL